MEAMLAGEGSQWEIICSSLGSIFSKIRKDPPEDAIKNCTKEVSEALRSANLVFSLNLASIFHSYIQCSEITQRSILLSHVRSASFPKAVHASRNPSAVQHEFGGKDVGTGGRCVSLLCLY